MSLHVPKRLQLPLLITTIVAASTVSLIFAPTYILYPGLSNQPAELLHVDNYTITKDANQQNPTSLTMVIRNAGSSTATLSSLTIRDYASNPIVSFQLARQQIGAHGAVLAVTLDTLSSGFYFNRGYAYTVTMVTVSGTQFGFVAIYN